MYHILHRTAWVLIIALTGCSLHYRPLLLDEKTFNYPAEKELDSKDVHRYDTSVNPKVFPVVLLLTNSNDRPSAFEFKVREALFQLNNTRVLNQKEFLRYASDRKYEIVDNKLNEETLKRFSNEVAPVMIVEASSSYAGHDIWYVSLSIVDGRSGEYLLLVNHTKRVDSDIDVEAVYPILNQLRRWYVESSSKFT